MVAWWIELVGFTCDVTKNEPKYIGAVALFSADMLSVEFEVVIGGVVDEVKLGSEMRR